jgi:hypothetical protein
MARKFFYVCAGLCLLILSFALGAEVGRAQVGSGIVAASFNDSVRHGIAVIGRTPYAGRVETQGALTDLHTLADIPGASPVVSVTATERTDDTYIAVLANGEVYAGNGNQWRFTGALGPGATPTTPSSWGALKVKAR